MAKKVKRKSPTKMCPTCNKEIHVRKKKCDCGYAFEVKKPVKKVTAQTATPEPPKPPAGHTALPDSGAAIPDTGDVVAQIDFRIIELEEEIRRLEKARDLL